MSIFGKSLALSVVDDAFILSLQRGEPLVLPAYVAIRHGTQRVLACGAEARAMLGRTPDNIEVLRVLQGGQLADLKLGEALLRFGLRQLGGKSLLGWSRVIIAAPTSTGARDLFRQMGMSAGVREVFLLEMGMATAIGMGLNVQAPELQAVLNISADSFEFAVISLVGMAEVLSRLLAHEIEVFDYAVHPSIEGTKFVLGEVGKVRRVPAK